MWLVMAALSALFAGLTAILAKCGIRKTDPDVATALRTVVVLVFSWLMVAVVGSFPTITAIPGRSLLFLVLSGLATGASWICYFKALSLGDVNKVVPIDKSSTVLTVLLAILLFGETEHLAVKLGGTALLGAGILLMVEKKRGEARDGRSGWAVYAVFSAVFAALTSILAKVGISGVESNLGTALRTCVVLVMAWVVVFLKGKQTQLASLDRRELGFIALSGVATGASWLCYYYAIQNGSVSVVVPIDKLSILVSVLFSRLVFQEKLSKKAACGLALMVCGTLLMAVFT
ncbi:EamA family transporter [uncultured Dysosmobacter sp.]|uniref:EamA family transporter n=1 Tax=uncultured Dysosmobacter sp. TaxID=2591384 RepID=UPI002608985A|nr:EamA family transporter [uncultured Dysosmobacter sp.]